MTHFALASLLAWWACSGGPEYARGLQLAQAGRWAEARAAFRLGVSRFPGETRWLDALAGVSYREGRRPEAARYLRRALRLAPGDGYARDFLGTIYLLNGNVEAALEQWNHIGKPRIEEVRFEPAPRLDPGLADRLVAFAPASVFRAEEYRETLRRLEFAGLFPRPRIALESGAGESLDAVIRAPERRPHWLAAIRGLPFETIYGEFPDVGGSGRSVSSMLRWDSNKRRAAAGFATPIAGDPTQRLRLGLDARDENWTIPESGSFKLRRAEASLDLARAAANGWTWSAGAAFSSRSYRLTGSDTAAQPEGGSPRRTALPDPDRDGGAVLQARGGMSHDILRLPARDLFVSGSATLALGRPAEGRSGAFARAETEAAASWRRLRARLRGGRAAGDLPFDEQFFLGMERDTTLWLRGHPAAKDGRKGNGPFGRSYGLANIEWMQPAWRPGLLTLSAGPLMDAARVRGRWYADPGLQARVELAAGPGLTVSWSRRTVYAVVSPLNW